METILTPTFNKDAPYRSKKPDMTKVLERAQIFKGKIEKIREGSTWIMSILDDIKTIPAHRVSRLLSQAERAHIVNRQGMAQSGLVFVMREKNLPYRANPELAMTTLRHIHGQASRALNIMENPNGYAPRMTGTLYGSAVDWSPLLP